MIKTLRNSQTVRFESSYPNPCVMVLIPPTSTSLKWVKLIKTCFSLFIILLKSTLAYVSRKSPLKASLNLLALNLVTGPTRTSNGSFGVAWIISFPLFSKEFILKSSPTLKKERSSTFNAYKVDLSSKYGVSATFNVDDLYFFYVKWFEDESF